MTTIARVSWWGRGPGKSMVVRIPKKDWNKFEAGKLVIVQNAEFRPTSKTPRRDKNAR